MRCFIIHYYTFPEDWEEVEIIFRNTRAEARRYARKQGYKKITVKEIF